MTSSGAKPQRDLSNRGTPARGSERRVISPVSRRARQQIRRIMEQSARHYRGGELVFRRQDLVARVFFAEGRVAWAHCSGGGHGTLLDVLESQVGLEKDVSSALADECRGTGRNFGEYIVEQGLLSAVELRDCLQQHITDQLDALFLHHGPVTSLFLPVVRKYSGQHTFGIAELLGPVPRTSAAAAVQVDDDLSAQADDLWRASEENIPSVVATTILSTAVSHVLSTRLRGQLAEVEQHQLVEYVGFRALNLELGDPEKARESLHWNDQWLIYEQLTGQVERMLVVSEPTPLVGGFLQRARNVVRRVVERRSG